MSLCAITNFMTYVLIAYLYVDAMSWNPHIVFKLSKEFVTCDSCALQTKLANKSVWKRIY